MHKRTRIVVRSAHEAFADGPDERESAEADHQMRCLDQPVEVALS